MALKRIVKKPLLQWGVMLAWLSVACAAQACDTPVFRYALERWTPSIYGILVFHQGPLAEKDQAIIKALKDGSLSEDGYGNYDVLAVDLATEKRESILNFWKTQTNTSLPWMVVRYGESDPEAPSAWAGPLAADSVLKLVQSPARAELARRVGNGDAVAWMFLDCPDKAKNESTYKTLDSLLKQAEPTIELPPTQFDDPTNITKLKMNFPIIRIAHGDPAEAGTVAMLVHRGDESTKFDEPVVVPVFGRGRALALVPGSEISEELVQAATGFLLGACSCEIKEQNPGFDLLISANWGAALEGERVTDAPPPALVSLASMAGAVESKPAAAQAGASQPSNSESSGASLGGTMAMVGGGALLLIVLASFFMLRGRKS
jgi:hypothetical protein